MKIHIAKRGETLAGLAEKYRVEPETIEQANPNLANLEQLEAGTKVKVPTGAAPAVVESNPASPAPAVQWAHKHKVVQGDTLWKLSKAWNVPLQTLIQMNPHLKNPNALLTGEIVYIPRPADGTPADGPAAQEPGFPGDPMAAGHAGSYPGLASVGMNPDGVGAPGWPGQPAGAGGWPGSPGTPVWPEHLDPSVLEQGLPAQDLFAQTPVPAQAVSQPDPGGTADVSALPQGLAPWPGPQLPPADGAWPSSPEPGIDGTTAPLQPGGDAWPGQPGAWPMPPAQPGWPTQPGYGSPPFGTQPGAGAYGMPPAGSPYGQYPGATGQFPGTPGTPPGAPGGYPAAPYGMGGMPGTMGGYPAAPYGMGGMPGTMGGYPGAPYGMGGTPGTMGGYPGAPYGMGGMPGTMGGYPAAPYGMGGYPGMMGGYPGSALPSMGSYTTPYVNPFESPLMVQREGEEDCGCGGKGKTKLPYAAPLQSAASPSIPAKVNVKQADEPAVSRTKKKSSPKPSSPKADKRRQAAKRSNVPWTNV